MPPDNFIDIPDAHWNSEYICRRLVLRVVREFASEASGRLLDVGCGTQPYRRLFSGIGSYQGVDVSTTPHKLPPDTRVFDGENLPFTDDSFDCVLATEVFEHVRRPHKLISEIHRVTVPGGRLLLTVPFLQSLHESSHDYQRFTAFGLEAMLADAGWDDIEVTALGGWQHAAAHFTGLYVANVFRGRWTGRAARVIAWMLRKFLLKMSRNDHPPIKNGLLPVGWSVTAAKLRRAL